MDGEIMDPANSDLLPIKAINNSIKSEEEILGRLTENGSERCSHLNALSVDYGIRYKMLRRQEDLEKAIEALQQAVAATPKDSPNRAKYFNRLSLYYRWSFDRLGKLEDIEKAIEAVEQVIATTSEDSPDRAGYLNDLSSHYSSRFDRLGKLEDLEKAIQIAEQVVATPQDCPDRAIYLNNLSSHYSSRFDRLGKLEDLDKATKAAEQAVAAASQDSSDRITCLNNLSNRYSSRFDRFGKQEDLDKAIKAAEQTVAIPPQDYPDRAIYLNNLSIGYSSRFNRLGKLEDLDKATQAAEQAVAATPQDSSVRAGCLNSLSNRYSSRFDRFGKQEDLEKAIETSRQAVAATPEDSPDRAGYLGNLSNHYSARFDRLRKLEDLDKAIQAAEEAVAATPKDSPNKAARLNNISVHYSSRFDRLEKLEDLNKAIQATEQAVAATPENSPVRAGYLINLSNRYSSRFNRFEKQNDLEKAIETAQQAVAATPEDSPDRAGFLSTLSNHYSLRFGRLRKLEDLEKAIQAGEEAAAAIPEDRPDRAGCLSGLSNCYSSRFDASGKQEDLEKAIIHIKNAFSIPHVPPLSRILRGKLLSELYYRQNDHTLAANAAANATLLLPRISPRYLPRRDQEYILSHTNGLSSLACSLTLQARKPAVEAFQLIEIGRAVMAGIAIDLQTDLSALREHSRSLYEHYEALRYQLSVVSSNESSTLPKSAAPKLEENRAFQVEQDLTIIEDKIRGIPGFARFQLPPEAEELKEMAKKGPIVAFNVTNIRSDALIITDTEIKALALKHLEHPIVEYVISSMSRITRRHPQKLAENNKEMKRFLGWLWLAAVKPVLAELGFLERPRFPDSELPRIWWIMNGIMGSAPLHAAGIYNDDDLRDTTESAMNFVVSSYISTAKALKFARDKLQLSAIEAQDATQSEILLISAHDEDLDFEAEVQAIAEVIGKHHKPILLKDRLREEVLYHIERSSIVHFSCHGLSVGFEPSSEQPKSPSDSYLLLKGSPGSPNEMLDQKLTVNDLTKVKNPRAQLAYLSACSTAEISAGQLKDEMIHIANAFQLAGYPHVVGTLWEADDESATIISKAFYESLLEGSFQNQRRSIATALHQATRKLMQDTMFDYSAWAPFVHIGA